MDPSIVRGRLSSTRAAPARRSIRRSVVGVTLIGVLCLAAACGGSSNGPPASTATESTTTQSASAEPSGLSDADVTQIRSNWLKFFDGRVPIDQKGKLLENGAAFAQVLQVQAQGVLAQGATATVSDVSLLAPGRAKVVYSILVNGVVTLPNQNGLAVLQNGTWLVSDSSFCALVTLEGANPPECASATPSG